LNGAAEFEELGARAGYICEAGVAQGVNWRLSDSRKTHIYGFEFGH
jgi:hypothetical protein